MASKVIYRFELDFSGSATPPSPVTAVKGDVDSRELIITPKSGSKPLEIAETTRAIIVAKRGNTTVIAADLMSVTKAGQLVYTFPSGAFESAGTLDCRIILLEGYNDVNETALSSLGKTLQIIVEETGEEDGEITASTEYGALIKALNNVEKVKAEYKGTRLSFLVPFFDAENVQSQDTITIDSDKVTSFADIKDTIIAVVPKQDLRGAVMLLPASGKADANICVKTSEGNISYTVPAGIIKSGMPLMLWCTKDGNRNIAVIL